MISHGGILESIASHLWAVSWQVSILIALIWISSLFGRKSSSNFRYWLWCIVIVRLCVPTGLTLPLHFDLHLKNAVVSQISTMTTEHSEPEKTPSVQPLNTVSAPNPERVKDIQVPEKTTIVPPLSITAVIGLLWLAGVLSILTVIIWRVLRLQKRLKSSPVITRPDLREMLRKLSRDMGIKRPIHLHYMELERINSPAVSGIINLRIYLPRHIADTWSLEELKPVLLHELAHIRRLDMIVNWLQIVLQALYFFHPLLWYANREIRRLREEVCDDLAIHHLGFEKNQYSQSIVNVVRNMGRQPVFGSIGIGFTERKNSLSERIGRIMNDSYRRYTKMKVSSIAALVFIGIVSVGIASAKPFSEKKADTSKSAQKESEEYSSKVILDLKWGDGPDEIGFIQIDQDKFGPGAFNVNNEGLIYILDSMHSRVIVFDQNGKPVRRFLVEIGSDRVKYILGKVNLGMDIDEHNNVWVIIGTNYIIHQYTAEGILQKSIKFNPGQTRAVRRDITLRNGEIFLGGGKIEITKKITASGEKGESVYEAIKKELIKNKQPRGIASRIGKISKRMYSVPYVLEKGVPTLEKGVPTIIQVIEENGTMNEIILEGIKTPYWAVLMDEDMHGNAYFSIRYPVNKLPRQIWKLNPDFELLAKIAPIPRKNITSPYVKDWDIDDEGNIYIMQIIDSGVQVIKWSEVNKAEDVKEKVTDFTGVKSPPEKKEPAPSPNIDTYRQFIETLDMKDKTSVLKARDEFLKSFSEGPGDVSAEAFRTFRKFYTRTVRICNRDFFKRKEYQELLNVISHNNPNRISSISNEIFNLDPLKHYEKQEDELKNNIKKNYGEALKELYEYRKCGLNFMWGEGDWYLKEDMDFLATFSSVLKGDIRDFIIFYSEENKIIIIQDAALIISWDELREKIIRLENFIKSHPDLPETETEIKRRFHFLAQWYITGDGNDPGYVLRTGNIRPELKKSYEHFLKENTGSSYYPLVKGIYDILKKNDFTRDKELKVFLKDNGIEVSHWRDLE